MDIRILGAAIALVPAAAQADVVLDTSLPAVNATNGAATATTTTDATGTRTVVTGDTSAANGNANRVNQAPVFGSYYQNGLGIGGTIGITTDFARGGNGSVLMQGGDDNAKGDLQYNFVPGAPVALTSLQSLSFDYYRDGSSTTTGYLVPVLRLDIRKNGAFAGSLVFEELYSRQTAADPYPDAVENEWRTLSATLGSGKFWATNGALGPSQAAAVGGVKTLDEWIAGNAGSTLTVTGFSIGFGSGWGGEFRGAVDNVAMSFAGGPSLRANFEVAAAAGAVPEPATWATMMLGFGLVGCAVRRRRRASAAA